MSGYIRYCHLFVSVVALLCCLQSTGQNSLKENFEQRLDIGHNDRELIYLHTPGAVYTSSDTAWFAAYILNAATERLSNLSQVAYVALTDAKGRILKQARFAVINGRGEGYIALDSAYSTGNYWLVPYTKLTPHDTATNNAARRIVVLQPGGTHFNTGETSSSHKLEAAVFPEGGDLVEGLESTVAVSLNNTNGEGQVFTGWLLRNERDTVSSIRSNANAVAIFTLRPLAGEQYRLQLSSTDTSLSVGLPIAKKTGIVMRLLSANFSPRLLVQGSADQDQQPVILLIYAKENTKAIYKNVFKNGNAVFDIDSTLLSPGINHLVIIDGKGNPVAERLLFKNPGALQNLHVSVSDSTVANRQSVQVVAEASNYINLADSNWLSAAVYRIDALELPPDQNPGVYFYLSSELRGTVNNPSQYFDTHLPDRAERVEGLLLTQGWSRFDSTASLTHEEERFPETSRSMLVLKTPDIEPASVPMLWIPGSKLPAINGQQITGNRTDYVAPHISQGQRAFLQLSAGKQLSIVDLPRLPHFTPPATKSYQISDQLRSDLLYRLINADAMTAFRRQLPGNNMSENTSPPFYGKPDISYVLDDYTRFPVMEEVLREIVSELKVRKDEDEFNFRLFDTRRKQFFSNPPLVLYDGVPVNNLENLMKVDPKAVQRIDLVLRKWLSGPSSSDGIINFRTYRQDATGLVLDSSLAEVSLNGLQERRRYHEDTAANTTRRPLFNERLAWLPDLSISENKMSFEFLSNDLKGLFLVELQGMDAAGRPIFGRSFFRVE